jgi:hypothetical protein
MKTLPIILAVFAVTCIVAQGWFGSIFTEYDWCVCHRSRAWLAFEDSSLRQTRLFLRIEQPGDLQHQHQFCDAKWERQYPIFIYAGVAFGILSAVSWIYLRKQAFWTAILVAAQLVMIGEFVITRVTPLARQFTGWPIDAALLAMLAIPFLLIASPFFWRSHRRLAISGLCVSVGAIVAETVSSW